VFYYDDGEPENEAAIKARFPHAQYVSITVIPNAGAGMCDSENGDLPVPVTVQWIEQELTAGAYRPRAYANRSRWEDEGLLDDLARYGPTIRRAVADWDNVAELTLDWEDGKQFERVGVDGYDKWICADDFFQNVAPVPAPPPWQPKIEEQWCEEWREKLSGPARAKLTVLMTARCALIWALVHKKRPYNWAFRHRGHRFRALWSLLHPAKRAA